MRRTTDIAQLGTILGVWAHPDDETFLSGGVLAHASAGGQRVSCFTATRGELGASPLSTPAATAALRTTELARALAVLGVREHVVLDHPDGGCEHVDADEGAAAVLAMIEDVHPDTILTFGPDGMTGHPDHQAISRWATQAWSDWTERGGRTRLLYATTAPGFAARRQHIHRALDAFADGLPLATPRRDLAVRFRLDPGTIARKAAALRAHRSQTAPIEARIGRWALEHWWTEESFAAAPVVTSRERRERQWREEAWREAVTMAP